MEESPENSSAVGGASCEESGWTQYLVDFPSFNGEDGSCSTCLDGSASSSLVSSGHRTYPTGTGNCLDASSFVVDRRTKSRKKRLFKKSRKEEITGQDDSLEDTATSPDNSPKIGDIEHKCNMTSEKISSHFNHPVFKGKDENFDGGQEEEKRRIDFDIKNNDLRDRDRGFVSLSMFVSHRY